MTLARFLRSPRWIAGHLVVLVTVVTFASLGAWQLERLDSRRDYNALLSGRMAEAPVPIAELPADAVDGNAYRRVTLTGTYRQADEVLLSTRSHDGRPGHHVLTPLTTDTGTVLIDRGWVPLDDNVPPIADAVPPTGEVALEGILFPSQQARRSGAFDGGAGALQFVSSTDLPVVAEALGTPLYPLWVLATAQSPAQAGALPIPTDPPALTEGSHFSYAMQWYIFALVVLLGYPVLLRHSFREQRDSADRDAPSAMPSAMPSDTSSPTAGDPVPSG